MVAGEDAEAAGGDGQRLVEAELGGEIRGGILVQLRRVRVAPGLRVVEVAVELAQHRAGIGLGVYVFAGEPGPQLSHHRIGNRGTQVGNQQSLLHLLPGILVEIAAADEPQQAAAQRILRPGEPAAQSLQSPFGRCDGLDLRRGCRLSRGWRRCLDF